MSLSMRGYNGSGTIFFSFCNLRCVFCQNWETSQEGSGREVDAVELADLMLDLQERGCHNINFVTPEHVVPQILEALVHAVGRGLRLPLVYNTSAYDSAESLRWMDGVVDLYMPDFKHWRPESAARVLKARRILRHLHLPELPPLLPCMLVDGDLDWLVDGHQRGRTGAHHGR